MTTLRVLYANGAGLLHSLASNEVVRPLLEPVLYPSRWRIRALGLSTSLGHPLFYWVWAKLLPQPYESEALRLLMTGLGLLLLALGARPPGRTSAAIFTAIFWITLPLFFSWMYFCNNGNPVWLASLSAMFLIYYQLTDWRIATLGSACGVALAWILFDAFGPPVPELPVQQLLTNAVVLSFSWCMALVLGISSVNPRRERLNSTLVTMGVMAHELRTPLATMALIADAVRAEAAESGNASAAKLDKLGVRLNTLVRNMNHQVDLQIASARLMELPVRKETISAADLVRQAVADYPYRSTRERECVQVLVRRDFLFEGSHVLFSQVVDNLIKNALRSLAAATTASQPGDLLIEVGTLHNRGRIVVNDCGVGIDPSVQSRIFEPFFSTHRGSGHGLGLAFCERVIKSANGTIRFRSEPARGAIFTIELPLLP